MKKKAAVLAIEDDLSVDLTLHDFSAILLAEFAEVIVKPYYSGNMSDAVKDLIQKAIREKEIVLSHVKLVKNGNNSIKNTKMGISQCPFRSN
jgi:hypothetical protein